MRETEKASNLSRATLYRALKDGRLKSIKIGARRLVRPEALEAFLNAGAQ
jgi:excisionase family DNA binding protein